MKKLAHYNENTGQILSVYVEGIHPIIPKPNCEITAETWRYWAENTKIVSVDVQTKMVKVEDLPPPSEEELTADFIANVKAECKTRIYKHASQSTQMNMTAAATAGLFDNNQMNAYRAGLAWISAMQARCRKHIENQNQNYLQDSEWPPLPPEVEALVSVF